MQSLEEGRRSQEEREEIALGNMDSHLRQRDEEISKLDSQLAQALNEVNQLKHSFELEKVVQAGEHQQL